MHRFLQRVGLGAVLVLTAAGAATLSQSPPAATPATASAATVTVDTGSANRPVYGNRELVPQTPLATATPAPTPAATPARTPVPAPPPVTAPRPAPVVTRPAATPNPATPAPPPVPPAPAAPVTHQNWLQSSDGTLHADVGLYTDCTGNTPIPQNNAAIDTCWKDITYFVGHNYGVFTPLLSFSVGTVITYWDASGAAHPWRIVLVRDWTRDKPPAPKASAAVVAQFQTCLTIDGYNMRILDAVPA